MKKAPSQIIFTIILACTFLPGIISCSKKAVSGVVQPAPVIPAGTLMSDVAMWLTTPNQSALLQKQNVGLIFKSGSNTNNNINVDTTKTYQGIDGFGFCLTGGSATLIHSLAAAQQDALLKELFLTDTTHIGISYLRISIGASDMSASDFTYDDMPLGQTDAGLANFSISAELTDLVPVLKKIMALNPSIKIMATPWTAPVWMKSNTTGNNGFTGGSLNTVYYDAYAAYLVKYIQAMQAQGITIDAISPQNEPLNPNNNPAMVMQPLEEANFVKNSLGPQLKTAGLSTKILVYDHNTDHTDYPLTILADAAANPFVDGSAFHLYAGNISALTPVHNAYPSKNIYFTEQYTSTSGTFSGDLAWHITNLIIGATKNWSRNVLEWNLATDGGFGPHTNGGCTTCQGALTIVAPSVTRNVSYYIIAHASKFVRPGAVRIASDEVNSLPNVAFKNTDGSKVLIVLNAANASQTFNIQFNAKMVTTTLPGGAVATYVW
ncbi:glycoside hydrolase family 30 beta sandwich domain-containing protein [Mucilaginibacter sp.]|uniref:glycoside hydrolase family 30 protein n=1 Tax=Mucilaginibacter sp. TaxID=1882438 RepID=UPI002845D7AB|nr:glycoside hydrolase family 30 beta sandwich domain-containing protein [Mucilaginibacter sp.]MDR3696574.1 glycoside hydrolase family 30 beta sandwich domain-containing protein [Mucilaginibacter sp.]